MGRSLVNISIILLLAISTQAQDSTFQQEPLLQEVLSLTSAESSQSGICGRSLQTPLEVKITNDAGDPVTGIQVAFRIIAQPDKCEDASLSSPLIFTDSTGHARSALDLDQNPS